MYEGLAPMTIGPADTVDDLLHHTRAETERSVWAYISLLPFHESVYWEATGMRSWEFFAEQIWHVQQGAREWE